MQDPSIRQSFTLKEILMWSIPAFLYAIGHYMYYVILSIVDTPVTVQVFGSLETVIVGVFSVLILKKRYVSSSVIMQSLWDPLGSNDSDVRLHRLDSVGPFVDRLLCRLSCVRGGADDYKHRNCGSCGSDD